MPKRNKVATKAPEQRQAPAFNPCVRFPSIQIPQGDGSFLVKPGKLQVISDEVGCVEAAKMIGLSASRVLQLCSEGKIKARQPSGPKGKYLIPLSEIERLQKFVSEE